MSFTAARQACTETGALAQISCARATASGERLARCGEHVDEARPRRPAPASIGRPGEDQLPGEVEGQGPRRPEQAGAGRDHPDADLGQAEAGRARGDDEVAGQDDLEAAAEGRPLDRGDQRLAAPTPDDAVLAAAAR